MVMDFNTTFPNLTIYTKEDVEEYIPYDLRPETYLVPAVFSIIFLVGLIGNGTLIFIFLRNRSMRNIPNTYIMSLSVGDFLVTCAIPFISTIYTFESWPYGEFVCKASEFLKDVSLGVTVLTLTMLSVDRYVAIVLPIQKHTGQHAKTFTMVCAISIWMVSIILAFPGAYFSFLWKVTVAPPNKTILICYPFPQSMWPWYPRTIILLKFLLLYTIPLITIASFYALMAKHLISSSQNPVGKNDTHRKQLRARAKVAKVVLVFVVIFAVCFFPNHLFMLWYYFNPDPNEHYNQFWHVWKIMGYVLTFVNSCLNPIALYAVSGVYRCFFRRYLFCCIFPKAKLRRHNMRNTSIRSSTRATYSATKL